MPSFQAALPGKPDQMSPVRAAVPVSGRYELQVDAVGMEALRNRLRIIEQAPSMRGTIERSSEETVTALV